MADHDPLLASLIARFGDRGLQVGTPPEPVAVFPAKHPKVGPLRVWALVRRPSSLGDVVDVSLTIGEVLADDFSNYDVHLPFAQRAERVTSDVVRFLDQLFADRLLFWKSLDEAGRRGWRERGAAGHTEPLVLDDRVYETYVWSGPLSVWRATPAILNRGRIRDERERHIVRSRLNDDGPDGFTVAERELAERLVADYESEHGK
jgi:hypothetical protein